jgi:hypothetical protein
LNPVNRHGLFARTAGSFLDMAHSIDQPLNQAIETNVRTLFPGTPPLVGSRARQLPTSCRTRWRCNCDYDVRHNVSAFGIYEIPFHSSHAALRRILGGWQASETAFLHSGLPFSVLSAPYTANNYGIFQGSGKQFANRVAGAPLYRRTAIPGVTPLGSVQWLHPDAFASVVDPGTGACAGGDSPASCQFGDSGRNNYRGPHFTYSEGYVTKNIPLSEHVSLRFDMQFFNVFNHPNFALPGNQAVIPGAPATQTGFGAVNSSMKSSTRYSARIVPHSSRSSR